MSVAKAIVGLCLIFFLGMVTGLALSVRITDWRIRQLTTGGPEVLADVVVRRLGHELELSAPQREQLRALATQALREAESETAGKPGWLPGEVAKIRAILSPAQAARFEEILAQGAQSAQGAEKSESASPTPKNGRGK